MEIFLIIVLPTVDARTKDEHFLAGNSYESEELNNELDGLSDLDEALYEDDDSELMQRRNVGGWLKAIFRVAKKVVKHIIKHHQHKKQQQQQQHGK